jgi:hypothetical protein
MRKGDEARRQLGEYLFHRRLVAVEVAAARNTVTPWARGRRRAGGEQDPLSLFVFSAGPVCWPAKHRLPKLVF